MQGRDKSVPSIKTLMICPRMQILKETPLPKGYSYMQIDDDMDQEWIDLQMMAGNFKEQKEAYDFFWNMDRDKFVFVQDENGKLVGSAGLYPGEHFGMKRLRLGKLVVLLDHQREGIATAMITKLCVLFDSIPDRFPLYVSVNAQQHEAIKTLAKLEFTPYFGFWEGHTDKQSEHDWEIVTEILREKSISA